MQKLRSIAGVILLLMTSIVTLQAIEYTNTSYYVAYDSSDPTQYALVMPLVGKIYTHKAGDILNLERVDAEFSSFPTYNNGNLCFSSLEDGATGAHGSSTMAGQCYDVNFFYTQKVSITEGVAFILYYRPTDKVYEGLAGNGASFKVVKLGDTVTNANSVSGDFYNHFSFDIGTASVTIIPLTIDELLPPTVPTI